LTDAPAESPLETLTHVVRAWDRFWFTPADPTTLGLIRICCGIITLYVHIAYSFGLLSYVGADGWIDNNVANYLRHDVLITQPPTNWDDGPTYLDRGQFYWSIYYHVQDPRWVVVIHAGIILAMFLFTIGFCTRITSVLTWLGAMSYIQRCPSLLFGMDAMMMILLFYLMVGPSGAALSVDRWLERWRERKRRGAAPLPAGPATPPEPSVVANFAVRLIQVHFCIIYLAAGTAKLLGSTWWGGTAPSLVMLNQEFAPLHVGLYHAVMTFLSKNRPLWEVLMGTSVAFTFFTELGFPFLVWNRRLRWLMICCSVMMHTGIGLFMGLTTFSLMMLAMLLAFVPPEVVRHVLDHLGEQGRQLLRSRAADRARRRNPTWC